MIHFVFATGNEIFLRDYGYSAVMRSSCTVQ